MWTKQYIFFLRGGGYKKNSFPYIFLQNNLIIPVIQNISFCNGGLNNDPNLSFRHHYFPCRLEIIADLTQFVLNLFIFFVELYIAYWSTSWNMAVIVIWIDSDELSVSMKWP